MLLIEFTDYLSKEKEVPTQAGFVNEIGAAFWFRTAIGACKIAAQPLFSFSLQYKLDLTNNQ